MGLPRASAQYAVVVPAKNRMNIAAQIAQPWRWCLTILPKVYVSPAGIRKIAIICRKFVHGVGLSNGWAELALKNPPPLVPSCLIASWLATGPIASVCLAPSSVATVTYELKF